MSPFSGDLPDKTAPLLAMDLVGQLVGVADLKDGNAVHAVAGDRENYMPVPFVNGDAVQLAGHYLRLGVRNFYAADLNAIESGIPQTELIERLLQIRFSMFLLDIGWRGYDSPIGTDRSEKRSGFDHMRLRRWVAQYPELFVVAASESTPDAESIEALCQIVPADRIVLSLDYRGQKLLGSMGLNDCIAAARRLGIERFLVLDLATVGTRSGPATESRCRAIIDRFPNAILYSGGGIRHADDVRSLNQGGCRYSLVATALHPETGIG